MNRCVYRRETSDWIERERKVKICSSYVNMAKQVSSKIIISLPLRWSVLLFLISSLLVLVTFFAPLTSGVLGRRVAIEKNCSKMNESKKKFAALSRVNHARLRDNNDTEKLLTNIIIEEGKIVQYKIRLSFSLSRSLLILLLLLTFSLSLFFSLLLFCLRGWCVCVCRKKTTMHTTIMREKNTMMMKKKNNCTICFYVYTSNGLSCEKQKERTREFFFLFLFAFLTCYPCMLSQKEK